MLRRIVFIILSVICALIFAVFQRITGPTYPITGEVEINGQRLKYKLPRSCTVSSNKCGISIKSNIDGYIMWKRFKVDESYKRIDLIQKGNESYILIPDDFNPASKIEYDLFLAEKKVNSKPVVLRFKGEVKTYVLVLHILFLMISLVMNFYIFFDIVFNKKFSRAVFWVNYLFMFAGSFILGPLLQKQAFGIWWSGFPFGHDMTDNKVLFSFIFWTVAAYKIIIKDKPEKWLMVSFLINIVIYLIPHSLFGSEYDYTSGRLK